MRGQIVVTTSMDHPLTAIDLKPRLDEPAVRSLLALSIGYPTPTKVTAAGEQYRQDDRRVLLGFERNGVLVGYAGIELVGPSEAILWNIAVIPAQQRQGIGRAIVTYVRDRFAPGRLVAETDRNAVGFYLACGFTIESLGERYPGTERFRCTLG
jgi:ribosomal protein S18 acetylase RimI-like enzyme